MIVWVFGGTAVGKKQFIASAIKEPDRFDLPLNLKSYWMEDGDKIPEELLEHAGQPIIIRWQWGRENHLGYIRAVRPEVNQSIVVVKLDRHIQVQRVIDREGCLKWDEWSLYREAEDVQHLVETLSMQHGLSVRYISGSQH